MIIGFVGDGKQFMGIGKTLSMTAFLHSDFLEGRDIYSNYNLEFEYHPLNIQDFMDNEIDLQNCSIGIDEVHLFADSSARTKLSRMISYFILQTQKRGVTLFWTSQRFMNVDLRLRNPTNMLFICKKYHYNDDEKAWERCYGDMECKKHHIIKLREEYSGATMTLDVDRYMGLYNRKELIKPPISK